MENNSIIDGKIYGRVEPFIYAFETNSVPNSLKVGDTYRPVRIRLEEWKKRYKHLVKKFEGPALVDDKTYFRDYSVHQFLRDDKHKHNLEESEFDEGVYFCNEFFKETSEDDVEEAIDAIKSSYQREEHTYTFYNIEDHVPVGEGVYERNADWKPRRNQQNVIDAYKNAVKNGRKNLLMYAVMRFGKSFTALCCAKETGAKLVVVVCGKSDVREEWKKNVQKPIIFEGYNFVASSDLRNSPTIISENLSEGKKVVVFLTLQDLLGGDIKEKHQDLFNLNDEGKIDLLIVDESHFAARSEETGKVISGMGKNDVKRELQAYDDSIDNLEEQIKVFSPSFTLVML